MLGMRLSNGFLMKIRKKKLCFEKRNFIMCDVVEPIVIDNGSSACKADLGMKHQ